MQDQQVAARPPGRRIVGSLQRTLELIQQIGAVPMVTWTLICGGVIDPLRRSRRQAIADPPEQAARDAGSRHHGARSSDSV